MSYTFKQNLVAANKYNIKCPYKLSPIGICVHNTANDASAENEIKYMISNNNEISFHVAIDDKEVIQGIPFDHNAWHAGDGGQGDGNRKYLAVEICYSKSGGDRFIKAEQNAALWIAETLKNRGWGIDKVKRHKDFSNKNCPHRTMEMGWQRFLDMVQNELNKLNNATACKENYSVFDNNISSEYTKSPTVIHKYSVGQYVTFGTSYPNPAYPCGIEYATSGSGKGKITAIVNGQAKYQIDNGKRYCNDGDISGIYTPQTTSSLKQKALSVNATYRVYAGGKWYSEVTNLSDYAGDGWNAIRAIAIKVDKGHIKYRVHVRGGNWYPYVTGYNINDFNNGYAGDKKKDIDAIEVYYTTPSGYVFKRAKYRLAPISGNYYDWQYDDEKTNGQDGYAGTFGISFGKFQILIE